MAVSILLAHGGCIMLICDQQMRVRTVAAVASPTIATTVDVRNRRSVLRSSRTTTRDKALDRGETAISVRDSRGTTTVTHRARIMLAGSDTLGRHRSHISTRTGSRPTPACIPYRITINRMKLWRRLLGVAHRGNRQATRRI